VNRLFAIQMSEIYETPSGSLYIGYLVLLFIAILVRARASILDTPHIEYKFQLLLPGSQHASSNNIEFNNTPLPAPIVDDIRIGRSRHKSHTPSDSYITSDVASDTSSDLSFNPDEDVDRV
jgi:hypothetical protein